MGCCQSSDPKGSAIELLKDGGVDELQTLKGKGLDEPRPASSTVLKQAETLASLSRSATPEAEIGDGLNGVASPKSKAQKGRPASLSVNGKQQLQSPNMIQTTPQSRLVGNEAASDQFPSKPNDTINPLPNDKNRHEEELNKVPMFITWDQPALGNGAKGPKKRKKKKGGAKSRIPGGEKQGKEQVFIPGSGNEKILLADKSRTLKALPPLQFSAVGASTVVKSSIAADRKKAAAKRKSVNDLNRFMKQELNFDDKIAKLIRQYAEISVAKRDVEIVVDQKSSHGIPQSRSSYACPVRADAPQAAQ